MSVDHVIPLLELYSKGIITDTGHSPTARASQARRSPENIHRSPHHPVVVSMATGSSP